MEVNSLANRKHNKVTHKEKADFSASAIKEKVKNAKMTPNKKKVMRIVAYVLLAVMLLLIALSSLNIASLASMRDGLNNMWKSMKPGGGYPYQINSSAVQSISVLNGDIFVLMDDKTMTLSTGAKEVKQTEHTFAQPAMDISGEKAIVYDRDGFRYRVENRTDTVYSGSTEEDQNIITACIGEKGNIALATLSDKATSRLTVINSTYDEIEFVWNCADYTISSVALSDNGNYCAVSVLGAENGEIYSKVFVFDFEYADPVCEFEYPGTAMVAVNFASNNDVVALGDNKVAFLKGLKKSTEVEFGTSTLAGFTFAPSGDTILVLAEYGSMNSQVLTSYSASGKQDFEEKYTQPIKSVYASDSRISVLSSNTVDNYSLGGIHYSSYVADSNSISVFNIGRHAYVYENGSIVKCKEKVKS